MTMHDAQPAAAPDDFDNARAAVSEARDFDTLREDAARHMGIEATADRAARFRENASTLRAHAQRLDDSAGLILETAHIAATERYKIDQERNGVPEPIQGTSAGRGF